MSLNTKIRGAQIAPAYAGDGLGLVNNNLKVNVDNASIEITTDALNVKALGITNAMLAGSIAYAKLLLTGSILNADLAGSIALSKLASGTDAQIVVANATGVPTYVSMSGDVTITNAGVTDIAANTITGAELNAGAETANFVLRTDGAGNLSWVAQDAVTEDVITEAEIRVEDESALCDGIATAFSLAVAPVAASLDVYLNGLRQQLGSGKDYILSGTTVTFATAPAAGDILVFRYIAT